MEKDMNMDKYNKEIENELEKTSKQQKVWQTSTVFFTGVTVVTCLFVLSQLILAQVLLVAENMV